MPISSSRRLKNWSLKARFRVRAFVLDAEAIVDLDTTGAEAFHEVLSLMAEHKVTFALSRANKPLIELLANYHLLDQIGANRTA